MLCGISKAVQAQPRKYVLANYTDRAESSESNITCSTTADPTDEETMKTAALEDLDLDHDLNVPLYPVL